MGNFTTEATKVKKSGVYGGWRDRSGQCIREEYSNPYQNYEFKGHWYEQYIVKDQYVVNKSVNHGHQPAILGLTFIEIPRLDSRKEDLYINAIRNLLKRAKYLNLNLELAEGLITEQDFEDEINENQESFVVSVSPLSNQDDLRLISEIIEKIGGEFSKDDVEDLFGIILNNNI